jgi:TaqI-like C-terminal specificity domain/Eco57I restriction-modification methylase
LIGGKPIKPYLEKHYAVASDRADLYAYFYEKGFELLRPGGRLGYISSSTFLRTGSGEPLRHYLRTRAEIETVVDFGDLQIFEGVTTYPAIVTMRRALSANEAGQAGELRFLHIKSDVPEDLARTFRAEAKPMPRARLGDGSWQLEDDKLAALRAKIKANKKTLGEVYGAPLYGIKTGLNEVFIVSRERRDELVARDARSAELLVPFLRGENIKRWRVESEDLFLINIPRGKVKIEDYPAIWDHLLPFKDKLEARATQQEWFELQQAQLAYQPRFLTPKISYGHFAQNRIFTFDQTGFFSNDKSYFIPDADYGLLAYLNSSLGWFFIVGLSPAVRGGFHELRVQYIEQVPLPNNLSSLEMFGSKGTKCAIDRFENVQLVLHRIPDLCPPGRAAKLTTRLREWWKLDFKSFRAEIQKRSRRIFP